MKQSTCFSSQGKRQNIQESPGDLTEISPPSSPLASGFSQGKPAAGRAAWQPGWGRTQQVWPGALSGGLRGDPRRERRHAGKVPPPGTWRKQPLLVKPHQLPPLGSRYPSKHELSGEFSWKVPRGPSLINNFRKIIQHWINIPQESYFWS